MQKREELKISTRIMYDELHKQNANVVIIDAPSSLLEFYDTAGIKHYLFSTTSDKSSSVGGIIASNKLRTGIIAKHLGIVTPEDRICDSYDDVLDFFSTHDRVVLKPLDSGGGNGVSTHISDQARLRDAYAYALEYGDRVIAQQHVHGNDVRMLVIAGNFRSAVERRPASVTGDGISTIEELIQKENALGLRMDNSMAALSLIDIESAVLHLSGKLDIVLPEGVTKAVIGPANLSRGGSAHEATHLVTHEMIADAEMISRKLGLGICGVDMIWDRTANKHFLIEVNSTPGINLHNDPFWGTSSRAAEQYATWLLDPSQQMSAYH